MKTLLMMTLALAASAVPPPGQEAFATARPGYVFAFPRDHGSHPAFRTEWWYFTGHLWTPDGTRRFGYQLTFFRQASPPSPWKGLPTWRSDQLHLAHAALTDEAGRRLLVDERLDRAGLLAGASETGLEVFQQDWSVAQDAAGSIHLHMTVRGAVLDLALLPSTPPVIFGEDGVSRKGADPSAASHYISFPRLGAAGTLRLPEGGVLAVQGLGWMDHEFSSNQLAPDQVGWDWAGIQLRDGRSLMAYRLRRGDGSQDPFSTLTEVDAKGRLRRSTRAFTLEAEGAWRSPASGATYPLPLRLEAWGERFSLVPILLDQELRTGRSTGITYWEGACRVMDGAGREVGEAYVELTGYAHSLKGRF
ncbi:MAG: carotenoid 1,2-hydratase [Holophagaceae bacterium]|uniref:Carotenoid 1,2-hydratase n=1 Tax=Candidatus Geothrix skivensis TaxID=2954439 RepID=A0A9D7XIV7_9BACT|nr:carotenoid 1,2-hydratase [Candidatus Geothrix skivensis]